MRREGAAGAATVRVSKSGQGLLTSGKVAAKPTPAPLYAPHTPQLRASPFLFVQTRVHLFSFITSSPVSLLSNVNSVGKRKKDLDEAGQD